MNISNYITVLAPTERIILQPHVYLNEWVEAAQHFTEIFSLTSGCNLQCLENLDLSRSTDLIIDKWGKNLHIKMAHLKNWDLSNLRYLLITSLDYPVHKRVAEEIGTLENINNLHGIQIINRLHDHIKLEDLVSLGLENWRVHNGVISENINGISIDNGVVILTAPTAAPMRCK